MRNRNDQGEGEIRKRIVLSYGEGEIRKRIVLTKTSSYTDGGSLDLPTPPSSALREYSYNLRKKRSYFLQQGDDKTYCLCDTGESGAMVKCSSRSCTYKWFHFGCVGMKQAPPGSWYCLSCRSDKKRRSPKNNQKKSKPNYINTTRSSEECFHYQPENNQSIVQLEDSPPPMVTIKIELSDLELDIKEEGEEIMQEADRENEADPLDMDQDHEVEELESAFLKWEVLDSDSPGSQNNPECILCSVYLTSSTPRSHLCLRLQDYK